MIIVSKNDRKNFVVQYQDDEILKIIDNVVDQYEIIVLFGGEPLLKENYHIICQLFEQYKNKKFVIFTNGTFDPDYLELLTSNKEIIQAVLVSLDGNRELHNKIRYESKGLKKEGTFDKILNNVKIMIERNISPQIQINCTKNNLSTIDDMIDEVFEKLEEDDFLYCLIQLNIQIMEYHILSC